MIARLDRQSIPEVFATLIKGRFDTPLKGTLRKELVYPTFERLKFEGGGYLDSLLDSLGYFKSQQKKGRKESETYKFSGIHSISSLSELFLALNSFFSKKEIANISQLAKRK